MVTETMLLVTMVLVGATLEVPPWVWPLLFAVGGFALGFVASWARASAKRIREDDDPHNDWQADIFDAIADAASKGDLQRVRTLIASAKKK